MSAKTGAAGKIAHFFIDSKLTPLIIIASILLGVGAVFALPREEEPQIIVPMIDIFVQMPGASAKEVEQRVTGPMEKLLWEIPGVEYVYSTSSPGMSMAIVRFFVGEDEEKSIVRLQSKLMANMDRIPWAASPPLIKPRYIDDVPILALTFWGEGMDHYTLRRVAAEVENLIKREPERLDHHPHRRAAPPAGSALRPDPGRRLRPGHRPDGRHDPGRQPRKGRRRLPVTRGTGPGAYRRVPAGREGRAARGRRGCTTNRPVYLGDVADVADGPEEPNQYVFFGAGPAAEKQMAVEALAKGELPAVTLTVAKRKGTNAITVAHKVLARIEEARGEIIPDNIHITVTRHYGETAKEKSDELLLHMLIAIVSVTLLIWFTLGHRESGVVALAIPVTLALTLSVFYLYGYTLNRITLFALIFSIGILVDDAIVVVENMVRHFRLPGNREPTPPRRWPSRRWTRWATPRFWPPSR